MSVFIKVSYGWHERMRVFRIMSLKVIIEETLYLSQNTFSDFPKAEVKFQKLPRKPHNFVKSACSSYFPPKCPPRTWYQADIFISSPCDVSFPLPLKRSLFSTLKCLSPFVTLKCINSGSHFCLSF